MKKMTAKEKEAFAKKATDDEEQALWEKKKLGKNKSHVGKGKFFKEPSKLISIRLPEGLLIELREIADEEGLRYQTYIVSLLTKHIKNRKVSNG